MVTPEQETKFREFIQSNIVAVLSTVSPKGLPMSATVYYFADEKCNFYFMTKTFSRKYENLKHNPNVALVIGTENKPVTVQVQGIAEQIIDPQELNERFEQIKQRFFRNDYVAPLFQMVPEKNEIVIYKLTPSWIRYLDLRGENVDTGYIQILPVGSVYT